MLRAEDRVIVVSSTDEAREALDLNAVAELFKISADIPEFERLLNDPAQYVNNLDLNEDGKVDFLRVLEEETEYGRMIVVQAIISRNTFVDVAYIDIQQESHGRYRVQVRGDESIYGNYRYYIPKENYVTWPIVVGLWASNYTYYSSPYYWDYYPSWYSSYSCVRRGYYRARIFHRFPKHHFTFSFNKCFDYHHRRHRSHNDHYHHRYTDRHDSHDRYGDNGHHRDRNDDHRHHERRKEDYRDDRRNHEQHWDRHKPRDEGIHRKPDRRDGSNPNNRGRIAPLPSRSPEQHHQHMLDKLRGLDGGRDMPKPDRRIDRPDKDKSHTSYPSRSTQLADARDHRHEPTPRSSGSFDKRKKDDRHFSVPTAKPRPPIVSKPTRPDNNRYQPPKPSRPSRPTYTPPKTPSRNERYAPTNHRKSSPPPPRHQSKPRPRPTEGKEKSRR